MKKIYFLVLGLVLSSTFVFSQMFPAHFKGNVFTGNEQLIGAKVQIYNESQMIGSTYVRDFGFIIRLELNTEYTIKILHKDYQTALISISTFYPENDFKVVIPEFDIGNIQLIKKVIVTDKNSSEKLFAKIAYNSSLHNFEFVK